MIFWHLQTSDDWLETSLPWTATCSPIPSAGLDPCNLIADDDTLILVWLNDEQVKPYEGEEYPVRPIYPEVAVTVIEVVNTILHTTTYITQYPSTPAPPTNAAGTRIETVTWDSSTTVM
jgi:hypothetical protein